MNTEQMQYLKDSLEFAIAMGPTDCPEVAALRLKIEDMQSMDRVRNILKGMIEALGGSV